MANLDFDLGVLERQLHQARQNAIQAELATGRQVEIRVRGVYILLCLRGGPILSLRVIPCGLLCLCGLASGGVLFGSADGEKYSSGYGEHKECRAGHYQQGGGFFFLRGLRSSGSSGRSREGSRGMSSSLSPHSAQKVESSGVS